jgi:hypothetical protein
MSCQFGTTLTEPAAPHSLRTRRRPIVDQASPWAGCPDGLRKKRRSQTPAHWMLQVTWRSTAHRGCGDYQGCPHSSVESDFALIDLVRFPKAKRRTARALPSRRPFVAVSKCRADEIEPWGRCEALYRDRRRARHARRSRSAFPPSGCRRREDQRGSLHGWDCGFARRVCFPTHNEPSNRAIFKPSP